MFRLWCVLIGYVFGTISTAFIYGKIKGVDIREHGSGNPGTTNSFRVLGKKAGAIVLICDVLKAMLAVLITWLIFGRTNPDIVYLVKIYTALGVVIGHDFPFYMKFKGGKGIACMVGYGISFHWLLIPGGAAIFILIFLVSGYVSLSSIFFSVGLFFEIAIFALFGLFGPTKIALEIIGIAAIISALAIWNHRSNIARLCARQEVRTPIFKFQKYDDLDAVVDDASGMTLGKSDDEDEDKDKEVVENKFEDELPKKKLFGRYNEDSKKKSYINEVEVEEEEEAEPVKEIKPEPEEVAEAEEPVADAETQPDDGLNDVSLDDIDDNFNLGDIIDNK
ncbi:MAG: glycerol-3-phosphate 1-O-acyltransferase PlsY [Lachnospiraceae bacterium]|nr:glycerol-3-phosphate 1-O-acyltransferase PlsY [Lachnospiraceae bacterium]